MIQMYIMSYRIVLQQYVIVVVVYRDQSLNINVGNTYQNYQTFFFSIQNFLFFFVKSFFFRSCYSLLFFVGRSTRVSFCCWFFFCFIFFGGNFYLFSFSRDLDNIYFLFCFLKVREDVGLEGRAEAYAHGAMGPSANDFYWPGRLLRWAKSGPNISVGDLSLGSCTQHIVCLRHYQQKL